MHGKQEDFYDECICVLLILLVFTIINSLQVARATRSCAGGVSVPFPL